MKSLNSHKRREKVALKSRNEGRLEGSLPIGSMYGIFTYIYHKSKPNVGKYTIHGSYGLYYQPKPCSIIRELPKYYHRFASSLIPPK